MIRLLVFSVLSVSMFLDQSVVMGQEKDNAFYSDRIAKEWATAKKLKTPESVCFNKEKEELYVSNINGEIDQKAGNGFISKLNMNGDIEKLKWVTGLHAPKGMDIHKGHLFVGDVGAIVEIDIETGEIVKRHQVEESKFLNDITIDKKGRVYCSDMYANVIYRLKDSEVEKWLTQEDLNRPNGVFIKNKQLLVGNNNHLLKVNIRSKKTKVIVENTGAIDGLQIADGKFLITDWKGKTQLVSPKKDPQLLINTVPKNMNAADLEYIPGKRMLYIPTFKDNRVVAYQLK